MLETNATILYNYLISEYGHASISLLGQGWSSIAFQVNDFIIRFPKHNLRDYIKEQHICDILRNQTNIQIPNVNIQYTIHPHAKHKKIIGKSWDASFLLRLSTNEKDLLAKDIGQYLYTIHKNTSTYSAPTFVTIKSSSLYKEFSNTVSSHILKTLLKEYKKALILPPQKSVLIHGDLTSNNSLLNDQNRLYGVFDWCNCGMGDPLADFIPLYSEFTNDFILNIIYHYEKLSGKNFDLYRLKKLYLLRSMYLLYWKNKNTLQTSNDINKTLHNILIKAI